jgi:acetyl esterase/lipase
MASWQSEMIKFLFRMRSRKLESLNLRKWDENTSVETFRAYCESGAAKARMIDGVEVVPVTIPTLPAGLSAEWLQPPSGAKAARAENAVIFYAHGGGYISGSCSDHRALVSKLPARMGIPLLLYEYRLAPEHPFPAALEDTLTAYRWLLEQIEPDTRVIFAGDSAGGGLCLAAMLAIKDLISAGETSLPLPAAGVSISPNTDMSFSGKPNLTSGSIEPEGMAAYCSKSYAGKNDPRHPYISPLFGDLRGLPPLLIAVGGDEGGLDDSLRFAAKAQIAGVDVKLIVAQGQVHCFPLLPDFIPESKQAMAEIAAFVAKHASQDTVAPVYAALSTP